MTVCTRKLWSVFCFCPTKPKRPSYRMHCECRARERPCLVVCVCVCVSVCTGAVAVVHVEQLKEHCQCPVADWATCPLTRKRFNDPVVACDGYTYERHAMQSWLDKGGGHTHTHTHTHTQTVSAMHECRDMHSCPQRSISLYACVCVCVCMCVCVCRAASLAHHRRAPHKHIPPPQPLDAPHTPSSRRQYTFKFKYNPYRRSIHAI